MVGVLEVQTYGDLLHIFVDSPSARLEPIRRGLEAAGIRVLSVRHTQPRMEEAFISLVRKQQGVARDQAIAGGGATEAKVVAEQPGDRTTQHG
jgi:hypothetical protein